MKRLERPHKAELEACDTYPGVPGTRCGEAAPNRGRRRALSLLERIKKTQGSGALWLVALALASYLTSFLRELYLLQAALGSAALDRGIVAYGIASLIGNVYAQTLGLVWIDGRSIPSLLRRFDLLAAIGIAVSLVWPMVGSCMLLASLVAAFEYSRQKSVFLGRQPTVLVAAVVAPAASVACWKLFGVGSMGAIVAGYSVGFLVQTLVAAWSARSAGPPGAYRPPTRQAVSIIWPMLFAGLTQLNGLLDRFILPFAGAGWAGAAGFAQNLAGAALLIVVGPLASEAVAGRVRTQPSRRTVVAVLLATTAAIVLTPVLLPLLVSGGSVQGINYTRVEQLTLLYLLSIPGAGYWLFRVRALQDSAGRWRAIAFTAGITLVVHAGISMLAMATGHPLLVPVGWVLSAYLGAALVIKGDALVHRSWRTESVA